MADVILCLTDGFEEIEALGTLDILRRGGVSVKSTSLTDRLTVTGSHDIVVQADQLFADADFDGADVLVIPGGTTKFDEHDGLKTQLSAFDHAGKTIAAICAAPMVPGKMGLLRGRKATCYPGYEHYLIGAEIQDQAAVVVDGHFITGRGAGLMYDFALTVLECIAGKAKRDVVAKGVLLEP